MRMGGISMPLGLVRGGVLSLRVEIVMLDDEVLEYSIFHDPVSP